VSQARSTLLLLVALVGVAAGVGLYAWKGVYASDRAEEAAREHQLRVISAQPPGAPSLSDAGEPPLDFTRLTVTVGAEASTLEKDAGGRWRLTAPVQARADQGVVEGLIGQLRSARFKSALEEHPDAETLRRYGLDQPRFTVQAEALVGEARQPRTLRLAGGLENTFDGSVFVRRDGQDPVYAAEGALRLAVARTTFELRDKQVLALDEEALASLTVKGRLADWTLARDAQGRWELTRPAAGLADASRVASLLAATSAERALAFPADAAALRPGFAHPALKVEATLRDGGAVTLELARSPGDAGGRWEARRDDAEGEVVAELASTADHLDRPAHELQPQPDGGG
jgi:hypothetical protein